MAITYLTNDSDTGIGTAGNDIMYGWARGNAPGDEGPEDDDDILNGTGKGNDRLMGGNGRDQLFGSGADALYGGAGADYFYTVGGHTTLSGGDGDDDIVVQGQLDMYRIDGGAGLDQLTFQMTGGPWVFRASDGQVEMRDGTVITGIERWNLSGTGGTDRIWGDVHDDMIISGGGRRDRLYGLAGNDTLIGDVAARLFGGVGDDELQGADQASLFGGAGNDIFQFHGDDGGEMAFIDGGAGIDTYILANYVTDDPITLSFAGAGGEVTLPSGVVVRGMEVLFALGSNADDVITGGDYGDEVIAELGADLLHGGGGDDTLKGDEGDSQTNPQGLATGDSLYGEAGNDSLEGHLGNDLILGGLGDDRAFGGLGNDTIYGDEGNDALTGGTGSNGLFGGDGADSLGGEGALAQYLYGGADDDNLTGGTGNDVLNGGPGNDVLTGGAGADKFDFNAAPVEHIADHVTDFAHGEDKLVLFQRAFAALAPGVVGKADFGLGATATTAGQRILYEAETGALRYDSDGLGGVGAVIFAFVASQSIVTESDFLIV